MDLAALEGFAVRLPSPRSREPGREIGSPAAPTPPPPTPSPAPDPSRSFSLPPSRLLRWLVSILALACGVHALLPVAVLAAEPRHDVLVVVGAPGSPEYAAGFARAAERWRAACDAAGAVCTVIGGATDEARPPDSTADRDALSAWFSALDPASPRPAWFVYLGHGTWDGREAKLNLRGADLAGSDLKLLLASLRERPVVVLHGGSASGPLVPLLAGPNRVIVTATTSGDEVNYARLGERLADIVAAPAGAGDLDMDGQVSVLEAFVAAARRVELFYAGEGRMATEHALIDDNGDGRGTPPEFFQGARLARHASDGTAPDGALARRIALVETREERALTSRQRQQRDALEGELEALRARKAEMSEPEYLDALEVILRRLSAIYLGSDTES